MREHMRGLWTSEKLLVSRALREVAFVLDNLGENASKVEAFRKRAEVLERDLRVGSINGRTMGWRLEREPATDPSLVALEPVRQALEMIVPATVPNLISRGRELCAMVRDWEGRARWWKERHEESAAAVQSLESRVAHLSSKVDSARQLEEVTRETVALLRAELEKAIAQASYWELAQRRSADMLVQLKAEREAPQAVQASTENAAGARLEPSVEVERVAQTECVHDTSAYFRML